MNEPTTNPIAKTKYRISAALIFKHSTYALCYALPK
jgi:hypothetical protein